MLSATAVPATLCAEGLESKETTVKRACSTGEMDGESEQLEHMPKKVCLGNGGDEAAPAKVIEPAAAAACHPHSSGAQAKASDATIDVIGDVKDEQVEAEASAKTNTPHTAAEEQATVDAAAPLKTEPIDAVASEAARATDDAAEQNDNLGPQEGLSIEVRWDIVDEATGNVTPTWFAGMCLHLVLRSG